jgi:hypothetical protein
MLAHDNLLRVELDELNRLVWLRSTSLPGSNARGAMVAVIEIAVSWNWR